METSGEAARVGGPETETSRGRWLAWLGLGADVSEAAAAVGFISAFALAGIAGMAISGDEVGAATSAVPGVTATLDVTDKERDCFDRYRWQPELRREICARLDELVGQPEAFRDDEGNGRDIR